MVQNNTIALTIDSGIQLNEHHPNIQCWYFCIIFAENSYINFHGCQQVSIILYCREVNFHQTKLSTDIFCFYEPCQRIVFDRTIRKMRTPLEIHRIFVEIDTAQNNNRHTATIDCRSLQLFCAFLWNHRQTNSAWTSPSNFYTSNCLYLIRCYY